MNRPGAAAWVRRLFAARVSAGSAALGRDGFGLEDRIVPYNLGSRLTIAAAHVGTLQQGDATVVTWGFVRDGLTIDGNPEIGEPDSASTLLAALDAAFGAGSGGSNPALRPWFPLFQSVFDRWSAVTGLTFLYEQHDDGAPFAAAFGSNGQLGVRADIRIGGHAIDGSGGVLAYNYAPDASDMVIDADDLRSGSPLLDPAGNFLRFRNVLMHELGHGLGLEHQLPNAGTALLEPVLSTAFDGPQFDDILGAQRLYGDTKEKNAGNDARPTATPLGTLAAGQSLAVGRDANTTSQFILPSQTDFLSIDGSSDTDYFAIQVPGSSQLTLTVQPVGPTYLSGPESGSSPVSFDARMQSDLKLDLIDAAGNVLAAANLNGLGGSESIVKFPIAAGGTFYIRVRGTQDAVQFYQLTATANPTIPVTIIRAPGQPANANTGPVVFQVTFDAPVAGFDASDVQFTGGPFSGLTATVTPNGTSGSSYFVSVSGLSGVGTVGIAIPEEAANSVAFGDPSQAAATPTGQLVAFDSVKPTIAFNPVAIGPTNAAVIAVTATFSESVGAFSPSALVLTNATVQGFTQVNATTVTFNLLPSAAGSFAATFPAGLTSDGFGNASEAAAIDGFWDQIGPGAAIAAVSPPTITAGPALFSITFSEPVAGLAASDLLFTGSTVGGALIAAISNDSTNPSTFLIGVTGMIGQGTIRLTLPAGTVTDLAGNPTVATAVSDLDVQFDGIGPGATLTTSVPLPTSADAVSVTLVFSEPVVGFSASDLILVPASRIASLVNFQDHDDGRTYTFDLLRESDGAFTLTIPDGATVDLAGNPSVGALLSGAFDRTAPEVSIVRVSPALINRGPALFRVSFSEPVSAFDASMLAFTGSLVGLPLQATVAPDGAPNSYLVSVTGLAGEGSVGLVLPAGAVTDAAGNATAAHGLANGLVGYDDLAPGVSVVAGAALPTRAESVPFTVSFSSPVLGFTAASVLLFGPAALVDFAANPDGQTFTFTLNRLADGEFHLVLPEGAAHDPAGNSSPHAIVTGAFDTVAPTAAVAAMAAAFTNADVVFAVEFDAAPDPAEFALDDLQLGGTAGPQSATIVQTGPTTFQVRVSGMQREGNVELRVLAGAIADAAGNPLDAPAPASTQYLRTVSRPQYLVGTEEFGVGSDQGITPAVQFFNPDGTLRFSAVAFDPAFAGGVRTAVADFNADGVADLVVGNGPGEASLVLVYSGGNGGELFRLQPFEAAFTGGVFIATGDVDGDGIADLIVSPDQGGGPRVQVYRGTDFAKIADFYGIDDPNFRGGARTALGDLNGDGRTDLLVSAGFGGGPRVAGYDGTTLTSDRPSRVFNDFFVFEQSLRNGVFLTVGDLNGDGFADLVVGGGPGGGPRVLVLDGADIVANAAAESRVLGNFFAGNPSNRGGVRVAVKNLDNDEFADLLVGDGTGAGSRVTAYYGRDFAGSLPPPGFAFDAIPGFLGGVFVG